tara:strand:+ start:269 stop:550 length:282 start_codon:yes stop_codon:yes gene_type:complete
MSGYMTDIYEKLQIKYLGFRVNDDWRYDEDYSVLGAIDDEILADFMEVSEKITNLREKCYDRASSNADYNIGLVLLLDDLAPYLENAIDFLEV